MPPPGARGHIFKKKCHADNLTNIQPNNMKYCTLKLNAKTSIEYACFSYELCCMQGCCVGYSLKTVQWQYWSPVIFCVLFIYFLSQYCMGSDKKRNRRAMEIATQSNRRRCLFAQNIIPVPVQRNPIVTRNVGNVNVDQFLDHLILEYRANNNLLQDDDNPESDDDNENDSSNDDDNYQYVSVFCDTIMN
ncbi:hypothetical protein WA026_016823 [Henosepilachna vigintioctopunctata]|uniref:Vesicular, overexpressed in cancer, prosurvival protein 1 n=1 Tax=Henosepilachna vigintioctopunctata TaxID=420089 RepID=A0AAW1UTQ9_9CUCU